jgi:hypothetical protein
MTSIVLGTQRGIRVISGDERSDPLDGADVTALCRVDDTLWAIADRRELMRVTAESSQRVARLDIDATCVLAVDDVVWIGTNEAQLFRFDGGALEPVAGFEAAPTRSEWYTPWGGPADTRSLASAAGRVYVNVHVGGIVTTDDDGTSWKPTLDLHTDVHQVSIGTDGTVWAATGAAGLGESQDGGESWTFHRAGLHGTYLRCAVVTDDGVLVTASSGPHASDGAVYRFDGERFHSCGGGVMPEQFAGNLDTGCLAANGKRAVLAAIDGRVFVSEDAGRSWDVAASGLPPVRAVVA